MSNRKGSSCVSTPPHFHCCLLAWVDCPPFLHDTHQPPSLPVDVSPAVLASPSNIVQFSPLYWIILISIKTCPTLKYKYILKEKKTLLTTSSQFYSLRVNFLETVIYPFCLQSPFPCSFSFFNFLNVSLMNFTK